MSAEAVVRCACGFAPVVRWYAPDRWFVVCQDCHRAGKGRRTKEAAAKAWAEMIERVSKRSGR